jgi:enamine deaminase RidA (YjgF/YER057c/UK114 family)
LTDISRWDEAAKAHFEFFASSPPASSLVEVSALIEPQLLIEIEATAFAKTAGSAA